MRADADNAYGYSPSYPMATRFVSGSILEAKWTLRARFCSSGWGGKRMSTLIDQAERNRFIEEQEKNISVIAPAGVGKTTSIVARIAHLARLPEAQAVDRLSRLIVVTYSVRAAQQMQQKARVAIRAAAISTRVQRAFQQTFFGTIHSYCVRLLERFGHYLGLPSPVGLLENDEELWQRFLLRGLGKKSADDASLRDLFHFYAPEKLYALGKEISPGEEIAVESFPILQWQCLFDYRDISLHSSTARKHRPRTGVRVALERGLGEGRTLSPVAEMSRVRQSGRLRRNLERDFRAAPRLAARRCARFWTPASPMPTKRFGSPKR